MYSTKCWMEHPEGFISVDTRLWWGENMRCLQALSCRPSPPEAACKHLLDLWRIFWQRSDRTLFSPTRKALPTYYLVKIFSPVHTGTCFFSLSCISTLTSLSVLFRGPAACHLFHSQFTAEQPWRQTVLLTSRGPACSDMLLNIVSVWTSVKGCFEMFDVDEWETVSNLTGNVTLPAFMQGLEDRAVREHKSRWLTQGLFRRILFSDLCVNLFRSISLPFQQHVRERPRQKRSSMIIGAFCYALHAFFILSDIFQIRHHSVFRRFRIDTTDHSKCPQYDLLCSNQ